MNTKQAPIIVFGLGEDGKPRAATFAAGDTKAVTKAAGLMGLKVGRLESPEAMALAKQLPKGKVFASGKGLVPLVKQEAYDRLLAASTPVEPSLQSGPVPAPQDPEMGPVISPWAAIEVGQVVLWRVDRKEGFFEAVVTDTSADRKMLTLRWRDFPSFKPFQVRRIAVGLICKL